TQALALAELLRGASVVDAAAKARVDRTTVHRWLRDDPAFIAELNRGKAEVIDRARTELRGLCGAAIAVYRDLLTQPNPQPLKLRAAESVLKMIGANVPEAVGPIDPADAERERRKREFAALLDDPIV